MCVEELCGLFSPTVEWQPCGVNAYAYVAKCGFVHCYIVVHIEHPNADHNVGHSAGGVTGTIIIKLVQTV